MNMTPITFENAPPVSGKQSTAAGGRTLPARVPPLLPQWLWAQSVNVNRHAGALRPFRRDEFGTEAASPTEGHIQAVNGLIMSLREGLMKMTKRVTVAAEAASIEPATSNLQE